ncbi:MAG: diacylglycerol kinase [Ferrovum myxofaciens]|uniref:Diacylglycerol kinase n=1 Tax=Ferrovum myxofaciens TaxID=416213 RepID=A0A9E6SZB7_9PROT|nr:MAG: diacylglycerol kinase [Ferrovum myxofaciens]QWY76138.1 MAG: diacylglycerol kinase [Ferrovum myxofaciens]QWY78801.1 MAG: diacylglycerol kinase [Ferrovum myxofaciens]
MPCVTPPRKPCQQWQSLPRVVKAFCHSAAGLRSAYAYEAAFREEVWVSLILLVVSFFLRVSFRDHLLLIVPLLFVLLVELLNSAIEAAVDYISLDLHPMAKRAKDMGSAAVLLSIVMVVLVWVGVLWE